MNNWINDTIKINFEIPKGLDETISMLEKYNRENEMGLYFSWTDVLDVQCKNLCGCGKLTEYQWDLLNERYNSEYETD